MYNYVGIGLIFNARVCELLLMLVTSNCLWKTGLNWYGFVILQPC